MSNLIEAPKLQVTDKGFLVFPINLAQNLHVGGMCICDYCNEASLETMYFIPVLANRTYCKSCYERWHKDAKYYEEDRDYEIRAADRFISQFTS